MGGAFLIKDPRFKTKTPSFNITDVEAFNVTFDLTNNDDKSADIFWEIDTLNGFVNVGSGLTETVNVTGLNEQTNYTLIVKACAPFKEFSNEVEEPFETIPDFLATQATGGTISDVNIGGINYRIHSFTSTGTSTFNVTEQGTFGTVDVLVVAGGGGGGTTIGGAGGAGGLVYKSNLGITNTNYSIIVGNGGLGGYEYRVSTNGNSESGLSGQNSTAFGLTALGGGYGAGWGGNPDEGSGGSGGGGAASVEQAPGNGLQSGTNPTADIDAGNNGSNGIDSNPYRVGGAGGGAGGAGGTPISNSRGGNGGPGLDMSSVFTSNYGENGYFAGGGGGGGDSDGGNGGDGGIGGGGYGGDETGNHGRNGEHGQTNTGGGGGAGSYTGNSDNIERIGGNGGSGVVLIRYRLDPPS